MYPHARTHTRTRAHTHTHTHTLLWRLKLYFLPTECIYVFRVPRCKCERLPQPVNADWFSHFLRVRKLYLDDCQSAVVNCFLKLLIDLFLHYITTTFWLLMSYDVEVHRPKHSRQQGVSYVVLCHRCADQQHWYEAGTANVFENDWLKCWLFRGGTCVMMQRCPVLIIIYTLLLPKGQTCEAWKPSKK